MPITSFGGAKLSEAQAHASYSAWTGATLHALPVRTNAFQQLIALIERELAGAGTEVAESKLLTDRQTGEEREVDVVIEMSVGIHPLVVGVECRDHVRSATVEWIDSLDGKFRGLPVNQVVAVSRSGFTKGAIDKARLLGIRTLTLDEAGELDWRDEIKRLETFELTYLDFSKIESATAIPWDDASVDPGVQQELADVEIDEAELYDVGGRSIGTMRDQAQRALDEIRDDACAMLLAKPGDTLRWQASVPQVPGTHLRTPDGMRAPLRAVVFVFLGKRTVQSIPAIRAFYGEAQVAHGQFEINIGTVTSAMVAPPAGEPTVSTSIRLAPKRPKKASGKKTPRKRRKA